MFRLYAIAVVTVLVVVACDTVPLTSPTGSTISISIDKPVLPISGQATVRAVVMEVSGTPVHNGTMVTFQPSIGSVNPPEAATVNGIATATFLAGPASGAGVIHAFSGGARTGSGNSSSGGAEVKVGAAAAGSVSVSATPPSVSQSGGTVTISALVLDPSGNPLPGVNVNFSSTTGSLSATTALSDSSGIARTQLSTTSTATVTATVGAAPPKDVIVTVSSAPLVGIEVLPTSPFAGSPAAITVTPTAPAAGTPARQIQSMTVEFGDGTTQTVSNPTGPVGFTHTYQRAGGFTITARTSDVSGNTGIASRAIVVQPAVVGATVSANPQSGAAPFTSTITVGATTAAGAPPVQSVRAFVNGEQVFSGTSGGAFAYRFGSPGTTYTVSVIVTDTAGNEGRASTIVITN